MTTFNIPTSEPYQVREADVIASETDSTTGKGIDEFFVTRIDEEGNIFGLPIDKLRDGKEEKWEKKCIKICSVLVGEYDVQ